MVRAGHCRVWQLYNRPPHGRLNTQSRGLEAFPARPYASKTKQPVAYNARPAKPLPRAVGHDQAPGSSVASKDAASKAEAGKQHATSNQKSARSTYVAMMLGSTVMGFFVYSTVRSVTAGLLERHFS